MSAIASFLLVFFFFFFFHSKQADKGRRESEGGK